MTPLWHVAGFALGAATALMGEKAAMACTVAVEETIHTAYRARMNEYHPDKVAHLGEELQQLAHRKALEIQRAYEQLRR